MQPKPLKKKSRTADLSTAWPSLMQLKFWMYARYLDYRAKALNISVFRLMLLTVHSNFNITSIFWIIDSAVVGQCKNPGVNLIKLVHV